MQEAKMTPEAKQAAECPFCGGLGVLLSTGDIPKYAKVWEELELAWGIIANAHGGDWDKESKEWQDAAARWRDRYFASLPRVSDSASEQPNVHTAHQQPSAPTPDVDRIAREVAERVANYFGDVQPSELLGIAKNIETALQAALTGTGKK